MKDIHYQCLNEALSKIDVKYTISRTEHLSKFDGLKTMQKLHILSKERGLPVEKHFEIFKEKQKNTLLHVHNLCPSENLIKLIKKLYEEGYKLACCSNSIKPTVNEVLTKLKIKHFFELILTNQDVFEGKPFPEIYWRAMTDMGVMPDETLIIEDSPYGLLAASRSSAHVLRVANSNEVTYDHIINYIKSINTEIKVPKWVDKKLNVLIPMAGAGSRFERAGYKNPKPLIDVNGVPMIKVVTDNINLDANFIYIVQKKHIEKYNLKTLLNIISPGCNVIEVNGVTEGAACTSLLAKELINNNSSLLIANSDQLIEWNSNDFFYKMNESSCDGSIITFNSNLPKWSFAKVDKNGKVTEVAEKKPISNNASVGIYYWRRGCDYVRYTEQMIRNNTRTNNEFYICPVYNEAIKDNKIIKNYSIEQMYGLGTPEDLNKYLIKYAK